MLEKVYERIVRIRDDGCRDCLSVICRMDDFQFNQLMSRLQLEIEITRKYNPPTRPALDPVISTELGVYRGDDENIGRLLGYPECCIIRSFSEDTRYAIDEDHLEELAELEVPGMHVRLYSHQVSYPAASDARGLGEEADSLR